jgi:hypothetical protein
MLAIDAPGFSALNQRYLRRVSLNVVLHVLERPIPRQ